MNRQAKAISSVALPVAIVGLAVVAAPEARGGSEASWTALWVAQRTAERAESLSVQMAEAARAGLGILPAIPVALHGAPPVEPTPLTPMGEAVRRRPSDAPPTEPTLRFALIDLPPPVV